jgi:TRAP-type C4-dicarboxylate transport system permease small subunit
MTILRRIIQWGEKIQMVIGVIALAAIIVSVTGGIISRYVFGSPFTWTEELATFLFIWLSFIGAGIASARKKHVVADFLIQKIPAERANIIRIVINALVLLLLVLIAVGGFILQPKTATSASVALNIPRNLYYLPVLIAAIYMFFVYLAETIEMVESLKASDKPA